VLGQLLEPGYRSLTLQPGGMIVRQPLDQAPNAIAHLEGEMRSGSTGEGTNILDRHFVRGVEQLWALGFAQLASLGIAGTTATLMQAGPGTARDRPYPQGVSAESAEHRFGSRARSLDARRAGNRRRMLVALAINVGLLAAEAVGGLLTGSLALLADAGHMLSDAAAIVLALFAARMATLPGSDRRTFGYQRSEVIAALLNGLGLVAISALIVAGAIGRLGNLPQIEGGPVIALGLAGVLGGLAAVLVLARGERQDVNLEGVLRHSAADALGSAGVVVVGVVVAAGGSAIIDPVVSIAIAALILVSSWRLIREPFDVLMEAAPADLDMEELVRCFGEVPDLREVHELHVWTLTAGFGALAAHVVVAAGADRDLVRRRLEVMLTQRFGIEHTTLQMEEEAPAELLRVDSSPSESF
jgi:cobalt-zinc-cadmium efflux system protein